MTVLQRKEATGIDSGKLGKIVGSVALVGAIGFGFAYAMSDVNRSETLAPAEVATQAQLAESAQANQALNGAVAAGAIGAQGLAQSAQANQALNGATVASVAGPFLAGHPSQTHKGRNGATPPANSGGSAEVPISERIPDYPQVSAGVSGTSSEASGSTRGDLFPR